MSTLSKSMKPVASFVFKNIKSEPVRLCLFPGHFDTTEIIKNSSGGYVLSHACPAPIENAGYECDQVADDYAAEDGIYRGENAKYPVSITHKSGKSRYRDFLNMIKLSSLSVTKIRITDLVTNSSRDIFGQELEVAKSMVGGKGPSDFIQFSQHIDPSNYLQNFIDIDLETAELVLNESTLAFLEIPANAHFQIDFTLDS